MASGDGAHREQTTSNRIRCQTLRSSNRWGVGSQSWLVGSVFCSPMSYPKSSETVDGARTAHVEAGAGDPIVLVHGNLVTTVAQHLLIAGIPRPVEHRERSYVNRRLLGPGYCLIHGSWSSNCSAIAIGAIALPADLKSAAMSWRYSI